MVVSVMVFTIINAGNGFAEKTSPLGQGFNSPEAAVLAIVATVREYDAEKALAILGPNAEKIIFSGDKVAGKKEVDDFIKKFDEKHRLDMVSPTVASLFIGNDDWPFPVPIIKDGERWFFDVAAGKEEILNRRIGGNELDVIQVMQAYVEAQFEYASKDRDGDGIREFAQQIKSDKGKKNGLYWPVKKGGKLSPFGPLIAEVRSERDEVNANKIQPYHGYYYKIITRQGEKAPGGAYDYVVNGNMILGFALVACPAKYGASGIMTFAVNQEGIVYEVDLGEKTLQIATGKIKYDLDKTWQKVIDLDLDNG
ncbi:MAG: DUF2950 domain-containing protein [Deltaproteobacteria bacterium]|nr:MAG: DUF2950 domain-containing protein [Deltaproteobacteria bacterium]